jgi:hypothetical protein
MLGQVFMVHGHAWGHIRLAVAAEKKKPLERKTKTSIKTSSSQVDLF